MKQELSAIIQELMPAGTDRTNLDSPFGRLVIDRRWDTDHGEEWKDADQQRISVTGSIRLSLAYDSDFPTSHPHGSDETTEAMLRLFSHWIHAGAARAQIDGVDLAEISQDDTHGC